MTPAGKPDYYASGGKKKDFFLGFFYGFVLSFIVAIPQFYPLSRIRYLLYVSGIESQPVLITLIVSIIICYYYSKKGRRFVVMGFISYIILLPMIALGSCIVLLSGFSNQY